MSKQLIVAIVLGLCTTLANAQFFPSTGGWGGGGFGGGGWNSSNSSHSFQGSNYEGYEARRVQRVTTGIVEDVRVVTITTQGNSGQYVGAGLGAVLGGLAGQNVGNGNGRIAATAVLAAVGGMVGNSVGERTSRKDREALEIVVSLDGGGVIAVTQEVDHDALSLRRGDRVRLVEGAQARVARLHSGY